MPFPYGLQRTSLGEPIAGPMLCAKALEFNKYLNGSAAFKGSAGWLHNFKKHHEIRELEIQGKKLRSDHGTAQTLKLKFLDVVVKNGFSKDNV